MHVMLIKGWNHNNHVGLLFCFNYVQVLCDFVFVLFGYIILWTCVSIAWMIGQSVGQSVSLSVSQSVGQSASQSVSQSISQSVSQPADQQVSS